MRTTQLRARFLTALAASGAITAASVAGCGGSIESPGKGSSGTRGSSGGNSSGGNSSGGYSSSGTTPLPPSKPPIPPPTAGTCESGRAATISCYTHDQLVYSQEHPQGRGGDSADASTVDPTLFDPNGCLPAKLVEDGCCNPATSGPSYDASNKTCCYTYCDGACCGRPFLVAGEARVADVCERSDWTTSVDAPPSGTHRTSPASSSSLDATTRELVANAWSRDAAMEHASVASFARFTLELLALGAPADIVLAAQAATRDEVEHALACFSIASRYAGRDLGPAKLDIGTAMANPSLTDAVRAAIVEGCIGETLSALLAEARLARAEDADVRAALRRIANEEARHAELAWRFVGWAIATGGDDVRAAASRAFDAALTHVPRTWDATLCDVPRETLRAHGLLDEAAAREVALRTFVDVLEPCAAAIVADVARAA